MERNQDKANRKHNAFPSIKVHKLKRNNIEEINKNEKLAPTKYTEEGKTKTVLDRVVVINTFLGMFLQGHYSLLSFLTNSRKLFDPNQQKKDGKH